MKNTWRFGAIGVVLACGSAPLFLGCEGCHSSAAPQSDGPAPCVEPWCSQLGAYCSRMVPCLYGAEPTDSESSDCLSALGMGVRGLAKKLGKDEADVVAALVTCGNQSKTCDDLIRCQGDIGTEGEIPEPRVDAGIPSDAPYLPEGARVIWGEDDLRCVDCAFVKCASTAPPCFEDTASDPACMVDGGKAYPDCCYDYRYCLGTCAREAGDSGSDYALCALDCDNAFPNGKSQFAPYATCMQANCASCSTGGG